IADQFRVCREFASRQGWTIAGEYEDHAVSGATLLRSGFQAMMAVALRKQVDVVLAESLDRFSRDQEDTAGLFKRVTFAGVSIVTLAEGDITFLHIGLKGTMNAMYWSELADKTRRGLRGRIENGKAGGGLCYGYRVVRRFENGVVTIGEREIVDEEATVIRQRRRVPFLSVSRFSFGNRDGALLAGIPAITAPDGRASFLQPPASRLMRQFSEHATCLA